MYIDLSNLEKDSIIILYNELLHAQSAHVGWLHNLNKALLVDGIPLDNYLHEKGHESCEFGKWIESQSILGTVMTGFDELVHLHKTMHDCSYKIAHQKLTSGAISENDYEEFTNTQCQLFNLISSLREGLNAADLLFDPLTQIFSRQVMDSIIKHELERMKRGQYPCALAMLDIDHFKKVNDKYGHQSGDMTLVSCANTIKSSIRAYDNVFRFGGEEFLILLPNTEVSKAENIINRIRIDIFELSIPIEGESSIHITVSAGVTEINTSDDISFSISKADKALYGAKKSGRNRVICIK